MSVLSNGPRNLETRVRQVLQEQAQRCGIGMTEVGMLVEHMKVEGIFDDMPNPFKHMDEAKEEVKGALFDVWAKRWVAKTDNFEWQRFTNCEFKGDYDQRRGGKYVRVTCVPDDWHPVWWTPVLRPGQLDPRRKADEFDGSSGSWIP